MEKQHYNVLGRTKTTHWGRIPKLKFTVHLRMLTDTNALFWMYILIHLLGNVGLPTRRDHS